MAGVLITTAAASLRLDNTLLYSPKAVVMSGFLVWSALFDFGV
jgi:hypothetical protein